MRTYKVVIKGVTYYVDATSPANAISILTSSRFGPNIDVTTEEANITEADTPEGVGDLNVINQATSPQLYGAKGPSVSGGSGLNPSGEINLDAFIQDYLPDFTQPFTQARQAIGRALPSMDITGGLGRSFANALANPLITNFLARTAIDQPESARLEFTGNPYAQSAQTFRDLLTASQTPQPVGEENPFLQDLISPTITEGRGVSNNQFAQQAANLARSAARNRYGALFANAFAPRSDTVLQQFEESPGFGADASFLPFLHHSFGWR